MHEEKKDALHTRIPYAHLGSEATPSPFLFFPANAQFLSCNPVPRLTPHWSIQSRVMN